MDDYLTAPDDQRDSALKVCMKLCLCAMSFIFAPVLPVHVPVRRGALQRGQYDVM